MSGTRKTPRRSRASAKKTAQRSRKPAARRGRGSRPSRPAPVPGRPVEPVEGATDPAGFFVARVLGEDAVRDAPHPLAEAASDTGARVPEGVASAPVRDERLGELPWGYGDDRVVALPRDPRSLYLYWDHAEPTLQRGLDGLDHPRVQLRLFARGGTGWERIRTVEVALDSRSHYLHELEPGRTYRAELHAVDAAGRQRPLGPASGEVSLPPLGPSPLVEDRFVRLDWEQALGAPLGPGHLRPGFPDEDREALARLSGRRGARLAYAGSAGVVGRPFSPGSGGEGER